MVWTPEIETGWHQTLADLLEKRDLSERGCRHRAARDYILVSRTNV